MIRQRAEGENITQAGRDINITTPQPLVKDNLIPCPECQQLVSRFAPSCLACGFPVDRYFAEIQQAQRNKRQRIQVNVVATVCILFAAGFLYFMHPSFPYRNYVPLAAIGLVIFCWVYRYLVFRLTGRW